MADTLTTPIAALGRSLAEGKTTSRRLVEEALARIADANGEGGRAFTKVHAQGALLAAEASDRLRKQGVVPSPLAGLPVSIKDLFDIAGDVTTAGSKILRDRPAAAADAVAVARLRAAGAVVIGRSNMTEFAFSGIGINPHYGTPANPYDRAARRIPGGSSSGAAVSVSDGMAAFALGTDTGGSVRIPAALCGIAGFKPTTARVPREGAFPLSTTLDSVGPLAPTVACCATIFQVLAGEVPRPPAPAALSGMRLGVPKNQMLEDLDIEVSEAFQAALQRLSRRGARIVDVAVPEFDAAVKANLGGGISPPEAYAVHRRWVERERDFDPRVLERILRGASVSAADYIDLLANRAQLMKRFARSHYEVDALIMPTVPRIAPRIEELERNPESFRLANGGMLRNTNLINFLDGCALSLPIQPPRTAPVGLMVVGFAGEDERVFSAGLTLEATLAYQGPVLVDIR
ncbi:MAG TPA: amidase [Burkholderiales bacterium]|nr:amidase [Burkholderiales bacterium]